LCGMGTTKCANCERLAARVASLEEQLAAALARIVQLEAEVARLRKNSSTSSKPPSSDIVKPPKPSPPDRRRKRSIGGQPGHTQRTRTPFRPVEVDQVIEYELRTADTGGLRPGKGWHVVQQVELVDRPFVVTEHRARRYTERRTGRIVIAPLPPEVEAAGLVGPRLSAAIAFQKAACHMSYSTIQKFWRDLTGLHLCRGQLAKVVQKNSRNRSRRLR
jgi:transposase